MADEITFSVLEGDYAYDYRLLRDSTIDALYENAAKVMPWLRKKSIASFASDSERFPMPPTIAAAALTDGTDLSANTAFNPTNVTLTVGEVGLKLTLTDLARMSSIHDVQHFGTEAGRAVAEKLLTDICALFAAFTGNTVGATGVALSEQNFRDAKTALIIDKVPGPYFSVLYPQQVNHLETSIGSTIDAAGNTGASARAETNDLSMGPSMDAGILYGVRVIASSLVATANAGADSAGFMGAADRAIGYVEKWAIRPEMERDASLRGDEIVVTAAYAVGELDDDSGVSIVTDR